MTYEMINNMMNWYMSTNTSIQYESKSLTNIESEEKWNTTKSYSTFQYSTQNKMTPETIKKHIEAIELMLKTLSAELPFAGLLSVSIIKRYVEGLRAELNEKSIDNAE